MEQYKVLCDFYDSQDDDRVYRKGDLYPRIDSESSEDRIKELGSEENSTGIKLIDLPIELKSGAKIKAEEDAKKAAEQAEKKKQQEADKKAAAEAKKLEEEAKKAEGKQD